MTNTPSSSESKREKLKSPSAAALKTTKPPKFSNEAEMCAAFINEVNALDGWTAYPETAGFDVLMVHCDGRQIGVEAKLSLNAKVADQILPKFTDEYFGKPSPDHRLVIVSKVTDASAGIEKMLNMLGVRVMLPQEDWTRTGYVLRFKIEQLLKHDKAKNTYFDGTHLFDWNPEERCQVPAVVPDLPAGVPSPIRLTPWKESAIKLIALMRKQGYITVKQIAEHRMGSTAWTQPSGNKPAWLAKGASRGQWVETEHMPPFDQQHPDMYAKALEDLQDALLPVK